MRLFSKLHFSNLFLAITLTLLITLAPRLGFSQCTFSVSASDTTICVGDTVSLSAQIPAITPLTTTFAAGNNHRGNMFDLTAINTVTITAFDAHPMGNTTIEIYYRVGTHVGFQTSSTGWNLIGSAAVVAQPTGTPTPVPVPINITIPAGQTYAFYVTSTNTSISLNYTDGVSLGSVAYQDANLQFHEGSGLEYPFGAGSSPFTPRNWNGRIHYSLPGSATYTWSTGASTPSITDSPITTTTYVVNAVFNGGACNVTDSVTVQVASSPLVDLGPDQSFCQGFPVTLDAGNAGSTYLWSDGSTGQTNVIANGGGYCVTVTNAGGCESVDCINITSNNPPVVNLGGSPQSYCEGTQLVLDAGNPGSTYSWNTGSSGQTEIANGSGTYLVTVTDSNGCSGFDSVQVIMNPSTVNLGPDTVTCASQTTLFAGSGHTSVLWSTGETSQTIDITASGVYTVTVTESNGCTFSDTVNVTFAQIPVSAFSFITNNLTVDFTDASTGATGWLWDFGDGNTSTLQNPTHTYATAGNYTVSLTVTNVCGTNDLDQSLTLTGIANGLAGATLNVSPNPGHEGFRLVLEGIVGNDAKITISDLQGRQVQTRQVLLNGGNWSGQMDLNSQPAGIYLVSIATGSGQKTIKWVKQ